MAGLSMKKIFLTKGQETLVDDEWFDYLNQWKWIACWNKYTQSYYAQRNDGKYPNRTVIQMSRVIMCTPKGMICDHRDHDTLNNQEYNLRNVTLQQNNLNRKRQKNNKLGEKFISTHGNGFRVQIGLNGQKVFTKTFKTLDEAKTVRDSEVKKFHGEFAYIGESQ